MLLMSSDCMQRMHVMCKQAQVTQYLIVIFGHSFLGIKYLTPNIQMQQLYTCLGALPNSSEGLCSLFGLAIVGL